ncbi:hypothetical protein [Flavobacterium sp. FPG59]|uniref:hypothetical protein n=1 Tax=Flavobacterium sp. FPG59 TaxID=1929267 RepID=UPI000A3717D2|nr:hypothetical protein [Flavobacterium sp. FPG59]OUD37611.1 hypothetical protein FPG59_00620 [Flavobacterium sp. FPG59]
MKSKLLAILLFVLYQSGFSQVSERLQGQVVFDKTVAIKVEVINATSKIVALTDTEGKFIITAEANDQLVFVAKNHEIKELKVTAAIIKQGFINMTLAAKAEELKEVIVQNMTSIKLSKDAKWEQAKLDQYALEKNASSLKNPGIYTGTIENGMDFIRIGKMIGSLFKKKDNNNHQKSPILPFTEAAKTQIEPEFYTDTLQLRQEEIATFLDFCNKDPKSKIIAAHQNILSLQEFMSSKILQFKSL